MDFSETLRTLSHLHDEERKGDIIEGREDDLLESYVLSFYPMVQERRKILAKQGRKISVKPEVFYLNPMMKEGREVPRFHSQSEFRVPSWVQYCGGSRLFVRIGSCTRVSS